ncbi:MAG: DNA translocase FtsK [Endomicrobia bacterium]|nr:DNA translocase FtsK [Endomicrobiia bacterium]MDW8056209.1 DNA translocase FtsK [Elusimicrobiota bacterium]
MTRRYTTVYTRISRDSSYNIWVIIVISLFALFLLYCNIRPQDTGILGKTISIVLSKILGITRFLVPLIILYWIWYILKSRTRQLTRDILLTVILLVLLSGTVKVVLKILYFSETKVYLYSGWLGNTVYEIADRIFGSIFGSIVIVAATVYVLTILFEISIIELIYLAYKNIVDDITMWINEIKKRNKTQQIVSTSRYSRRTITQQQSDKKFEMPNSVIVETNKNFTAMLQKQTSSVVQDVEIEKKPLEVTQKEKKLEKEKTVLIQEYKLPKIDILDRYPVELPSQYELQQQARQLEQVLKEFDINSKVVNISAGPVVTMYELELEPGIKVQSVSALRDNIALSMKASSIRIIAPLPGKGTIGIEIPNAKPQIVSLRDVLESKDYEEMSRDMKLPIVLGKTVEGKIYVDDIVPMPHMLVAGATGSGKSVCLHGIIISLLYRCTPDYLKLVLIDPKRLELMHYDGIPHLYDPNCEPEKVRVITSSKDAAKVLNSLVKVMEQRYERFASVCVRNIEGYNELMKSRNEPQEFYIVVIIDEFADLILTSPKEVEDAIQRLAQMARAVGIHLILATQRPSVDVITGVIKANFSCRIAFQVLSKTDSRIILDTTGAEELLGRGDMLYLPTGAPKPIRLQGAYVSEKDINRVVNFIREQKVKPSYQPLIKHQEQQKLLKEKEVQQSEDLYAALLLIKERRRISQDLLKAYFRSSAKASDILSLLEVKGFIYKPEGTNRWSINFDRVEEAIKNYNEKKTFD